MKEATSETSNLIVVAVCVAILIAIFSYTVWPIIKTRFEADSSCAKAKCSSKDDDGDGMVECYYKGNSNPIECPYKG